MAEAQLSDVELEEQEPTNEAIQLYLDFCCDRDDNPSERAIRYFLRNNPFKSDIKRFIDPCRKSYSRHNSGRRRRVPETEQNTLVDLILEKDWNVLLFICKQSGSDPHDLVNNPPTYLQTLETYAINLRTISIEYRADEHKRIQKLEIHSAFFSTNKFSCIGHLDHLRELTIDTYEDRGVIQFPLDDVTNELRYLTFFMQISCSDEFRRLVTSVSSPHLTVLTCNPEVLPIIHKCESLEDLTVYFQGESLEEKDVVFKQLLECPFVERLQGIMLGTWSMTTDQFERLLLQVVPRFPNLEHLQFVSWSSYDESRWLDAPLYLKAASDRVRSDKSIRVSKSLRKLGFPEEIEETIFVTGEEERLAVNEFLKTFSSIDHLLGGGYSLGRTDLGYIDKTRLHPESKYLLITNMVGRRLLTEETGQNLGL